MGGISFLKYLFLAALGLHCFLCTCVGFPQLQQAGATLHCGAWASLVAEHRLQALGLQYLQHVGSEVAAHGLWGMWASVVVAQSQQLRLKGSRAWMGLVVAACGLKMLCGTWNLPRPGIEPVSPVLGRWILIHCEGWHLYFAIFFNTWL